MDNLIKGTNDWHNTFNKNAEEFNNFKNDNNNKITILESDIQNVVNPVTYDYPIITFVDDDCQSEFLSVTKPIYEKNDIRATLAVITDKVGADGYMDKDTLLLLQDNGYEIISHTKTHNIDYFLNNVDNTPDSIYEEEFSKSKQYLYDNGFGEVDTIVYPFANFDYGKDNNNNTIRIKNIAKKYYKHGLNADGNYNISPNDTMYLNRFFLDKSTINLDFVKKIIDEVYDNNAWLIFGVHSWSKTQIDGNFLDEVIQYVKSKNISILRFKEAEKLKSNIISIGEYTDIEKGFFAGRDGSVINKCEKLKLVTTDFEANLSYGKDKFIKNKLTISEISSVNDSLCGFGGILITYNGSDYYLYQTYITVNGTKMYNRMWDLQTQSWTNWTDMTSQNYNIIAGVQDKINMETDITKFDIYKETVVQIDAANDTLLNNGGILKVFRGDLYYCYSLFYPLNQNKIYKRTWNVENNRWNDFSPITGA